MPDPISVKEVDRLLQQHIQLARTVDCPLEKATGKILRHPIVADRDLPPFDRVMMDGYAIRASGIDAGEFKVSGQAMAGDPMASLEPGDQAAVGIMTGAPLPHGADTIVPVEATVPVEGGFRLNGEVDSGQFIHRQGSDFRKGTVLVDEGVLIRSIEAGIAASCGYATVKVSRRPRIAVFGTGNELVPVGDQPEAHQIRRSNAMAVEHALAGAAFPVGITGHFSDDVEAESVRLEKAISTADVVIISGAVSMGKLDWIPSALDGIGRRIFHGVAQRPGKPMGFWLTDDGTRIFALPGNPVSTLVATYRYIIPFLRARQGLRPGEARKVTLAHPIDFTKPMTAFIPVCLESGSEATPLPLNNSADYARLAGTDGFVELPPDSESFPTGTKLIFTPWKS